MMRVEGLRKTFGAIVAVDAISFTAQDGMVTGLLGPNGAGKTTTIRALSGIARPDAGDVRVDDIDVVADPRGGCRRLGVLPEAVGLYDRLTAREHLHYAGALHGLRGADLRRRSEEAIARLGLERFADRKTGSLSFGQRRRVALARALVHEPANVILDEPTNGLDVTGTRQTRTEIRRLASEGHAVILSSHVMPEVAATCDRIIVLARGRVAANGTPDEILAATRCSMLEDAFVRLIGTDEGLN